MANNNKKGGVTIPKEVRRYRITLILLVFIVALCALAATPISSRITQGLDIQGGVSVTLTAVTTDGSAPTSDDMDSVVSIVSQRVNALGASEATVSLQGNDMIQVQIPGATDSEAAISAIGRTGKLEFVDLNDLGDQDALLAINAGKEDVPLTAGTYTSFMTGDAINSVNIGPESEGSAYYAVNLRLDNVGKSEFSDVSTELAPTNGKIGIVLDGVLISAPQVISPITNGQVAITGSYTLEEATSLKTVLDSGSLPVSLEYSESRVVGPTLGQASLIQGLMAMAVGFIIVVIYLFFFYRGLGLLTTGSLLVFGALYMGILAALSAAGLFALSLPGIAGIVLTIGMAADSSILVLERVKEEVRMGKSVRAASISGVSHGIKTSIDADIVSFITAFSLFLIAVGSVKGFGLTLALGIVCDILTMFLFKAPALRLLARGQLQKHSSFWGVKNSLAVAEENNPRTSTKKGGVQ